MSQAVSVGSIADELQALNACDFIRYRAATRERLLKTPKTSPDYPRVKKIYDAAKTEYYRRTRDGLTIANKEAGR